MKEKIVELAVQAGFMKWDNEKWNPGDVIDWSARYDREFEKFAELLVQKCTEIINDAVDQREPASTYANKIKEYFNSGTTTTTTTK
jgi:hypothetical protein